MRFPIVKTHIEIRLLDLKRDIEQFQENLKLINKGEDYHLKNMGHEFSHLLFSFNELCRFNNTALKFYDEFCDCGSGVLPLGSNENGDPICKECYN